MDESVDNGLMDIAPDLSNAVLKLRSSVWPWLHVVKFSLYMVPKVFDGIHVRAECRPWQHPDVVLLKKVGGFSQNALVHYRAETRGGCADVCRARPRA